MLDILLLQLDDEIRHDGFLNETGKITNISESGNVDYILNEPCSLGSRLGTMVGGTIYPAGYNSWSNA